jgi:polysaccharide transporter, PST family
MPIAEQIAPPDAPVAPPTRERSAHATLWALADLGGGQVASFLIFLVLARVIGPAQYGIFAIAMSLYFLLTIIQYYGFADAIVQRPKIDVGFLDTVFWCDLILASSLVAFAQLCAPLAAGVFGDPELDPMIRVLSLLSLLQAMVTVPTALFRRALQMKVLAVRTLVSYAAGGCVGIILALRGYGVWALVDSQVAQYIAIICIMFWRSTWRPGLRARVNDLRELVSFAGHFMFAYGVKLATDRTSQLFVGLFASATEVGYYALASRILLTMITLTINPFERVGLPVLSRHADNLPMFRTTYRKMILVVNSIWTPSAVAFGISAPILIPVLFGSRWTPAASVLQAMSFMSPTLGLWFLSGQALAALGQTHRFTHLSLCYVALAFVAFPVSSYFGIVPAGAAWAVLSVLMVPLHLRTLNRVCGLPLRAILSDWSRVTLSAVVMLAITLAVLGQLRPGIPALVVALATGSLAYVLLLELVLLPGYVGRMIMLLRGAISNGHSAPHEEPV